MSYDINTRSKPHMNIGTIGHVDHGKTTLTAAITKASPACVGNTVRQHYMACCDHYGLFAWAYVACCVLTTACRSSLRQEGPSQWPMTRLTR